VYEERTKKINTKQTKTRFSCPAWKRSETILVDWEAMEKQENK